MNEEAEEEEESRARMVDLAAAVEEEVSVSLQARPVILQDPIWAPMLDALLADLSPAKLPY